MCLVGRKRQGEGHNMYIRVCVYMLFPYMHLLQAGLVFFIQGQKQPVLTTDSLGLNL